MRDWLKILNLLNQLAAVIGLFLALILFYLAFFLNLGRWIGEHVNIWG